MRTVPLRSADCGPDRNGPEGETSAIRALGLARVTTGEVTKGETSPAGLNRGRTGRFMLSALRPRTPHI